MLGVCVGVRARYCPQLLRTQELDGGRPPRKSRIAAGVSDERIMDQTGYRSLPMVNRYVRKGLVSHNISVQRSSSAATRSTLESP
jgi:hypothetical protein